MTISQREARRLRKRVRQLEHEIDKQRSSWSREWPGGEGIRSMDATAYTDLRASIQTARMLGHAVVVTLHDTRLMFYALPLPKR